MLARIFGASVTLDWAAQPVVPGSRRAALHWQGPSGASATLVSALRGWHGLRLEATEEAARGGERVRYCSTPALGVFCGSVGASGEALVSEGRLRRVARRAADGRGRLEEQLDALLGRPWDDELAPFRNADADTCVRWLDPVG